MSIPCKMRPAGLESLPMGYIRLDFLESTGTQYITLPEVQTGEDFGIDYTFLKTSGQNWALNLQTGSAVHYRIDVRNFDTGEIGISWGYYSNSKWPTVGEGSESCRVVANYKNDKRLLIAGLKTYEWTLNTPNTVKNGFYLFAITEYTAEGVRYKGQNVKIKIKHFAASKGQTDVAHLVPALDNTGIPCMFDLVTRKPFYNKGTGQFIAGLSMNQALNLANLPVPTTSNALTISLPKEASLVQYNQEVNAAIADADGKGWSVDVQYRDKFDDEAILNKYAECTVLSDIIAVNADYINDLTDEGEWIYPLENLENTINLFKDSNIRSVEIEFPKASISNNTFYGSKKLEHARVYFPNITTTYFRGLFEQCTALKTFYLNAPNAKCVIALLSYTNIEECTPDNLYAPLATDFSFFAHMSYKIKRVTFDFSNATNLDWAFSNGTLVEFTSELPNLSTAADGFKGKLNKESALRILNSIPAYTSGTHKMSIHIHVDHQSDEEVINAISKAEAKGWTMTVAWKGTPTAQTASTFGLRKSPIYAKLGTVELPDGTVEDYLDWGHYVTNWEENGYQEFASLEEAYEHFNLEMPAEEESDAVAS